jgi:transposase
MGRISKMGDQYLRRLLVNGMTSQSQSVRRNSDAHPWVTGLLRRKLAKLVAVAMANKAARIAWVVMTRNEICPTPKLVAEGAV